MSRRLLLAALSLLAALLAPAGAAIACPPEHWVATWAASPGDARVPGFEDQTLRMIVTPHLGGERLRVRLSNRFGTQPVTFDAVAVGIRLAGASLVPGSGRRVSFGGRGRVTVPPGDDVVSDPVALSFDAFEPLAVSLSIEGESGPATEHLVGQQTSYVSARGGGEHVDDESGDPYTAETTARYFLTGVDVLAPASHAAVVAFGDSYTDGYLGSPSPLAPNTSGLDLDGRYPDLLARRLLETPGAPRLAVVNAGITGNRLLAAGIIPQHGPAAVDRFEADALGQAGATHVLVLAGTNDIGARSATAAEIARALAQLVREGHDAGLRVLLGTIPPARGALSDTYGDAEADAMRREVNAWIRTSSGADAVVDFDLALQAPGNPDRLADRYDSGDHLHPNLAGYQAMADAVDLAMLEADVPSVRVGLRQRDRRGLRRALVLADGRRVGVIRRPRQRLAVPVGAHGTVVRMRVSRSGRPPVWRTLRLGPC
ncbi:MAG TPA: GDSL-type esterase/lipase family protein [Capillimicrobium sp.]|nr:GDSL-type esterase/lipase family protein [Capillimicrobium sp.]